jgi:hypothetical protein
MARAPQSKGLAALCKKNPNNPLCKSRGFTGAGSKKTKKRSK